MKVLKQAQLNEWLDVLAKEQVLRYFNVDLPLWIREKDVRLTCRLVREVRELFSYQGN